MYTQAVDLLAEVGPRETVADEFPTDVKETALVCTPEGLMVPLTGTPVTDAELIPDRERDGPTGDTSVIFRLTPGGAVDMEARVALG